MNSDEIVEVLHHARCRCGWTDHLNHLVAQRLLSEGRLLPQVVDHPPIGEEHRKSWYEPGPRIGLERGPSREVRAGMAEARAKVRAALPPDPADKQLADELHEKQVRCDYWGEGDEQGHLLDARRILGWSSDYEPVPSRDNPIRQRGERTLTADLGRCSTEHA